MFFRSEFGISSMDKPDTCFLKMNDTDLTQLEARAEKLWQELEQLQAPYLEKRLEWAEVNRELERAKLRAEILAEQKVA